MSVSQETLEMITTAIKSGANMQGTLVRSKLTNRLVWKANDQDENDPFNEYLALVGAGGCQHQGTHGRATGRTALGEIQAHGPNRGGGGAVAVREKSTSGRKGNKMHDKENWQDHWEIMKKAGQYCSFCKSNKEVREIYMSHNLKGPDGEVTCPILLKCVCQCCGQHGHTIAYCPENKSGTSILKMMNHYNRI